MKFRMIPKKKMQEGINLCKRNITDYLNEARLIVENGNFNHAYVSVQLSLEEFGKIRMLREALSDNEGKEIIPVKETVFTNHRSKSDKAWKFLNPTFRKIFGEIGFEDTGEGGFDPRGFQTTTTAGHKTRLQCAFVDFHLNKQWLGRNIEKERLMELINHIEEKLLKAQPYTVVLGFVFPEKDADYLFSLILLSNTSQSNQNITSNTL